ncbi:hypothetical protein QYE76_000598 [Lolium multiflorum]|uniref:CCHC-type domain-containing protein n=1 Tax=Lolium multiflorum TaxID=4521 RepID=A0AAD8VYI3_LOLMU|nr:hypothetical protein QYE76_000598 [Lolium multiflorum]
MENYSLLMGAAAVMKMAVETAVEMTRGQFPVRQGAGTESSVPRIGLSRWRRLWMDMASPINFNQFLEKEKLKSNGSNFTDWFRHVRIFLNGGNLQYVLDAPLGDPPAETETDEVKVVYATRKTRYSQVQCAILCSLEADLQKCFEHHDPHELVNELKTIFETHAAVECYEASKHFFSCMMEEGSSVSEHMLAMTGHAKKLSDLGIVIPNRLGINRVLQSLPPSYKNFVMNYNMQNMNKELPELFAMLKSAEIEIKKEHQVLMVNKTTSFKKQGKSKGKNKKSGKKAATPPVKPKTGPKPDAECYYCKEKGHWKRNCSKYLADLKSGLVKKKKEGISDIHVIDVYLTGSRTSTWVFDTGSVAHICNSKQELKNKRRLLKDEVTMRVGNGSKVDVISVGTLPLHLPSGLVLSLNNCYFVPALSMNIISGSCLMQDGYSFKSENNGCSIFMNNIFYGRAPEKNVWGCEAYVKKLQPDKLEPKAEKCVFIGYPKETIGYTFYHRSEGKIFVAKNGTFLEKEFLTKEVTGRKVELDEIEESLLVDQSSAPEDVPVPPAPATEEANDNDHETSNEIATEPRRSTRDHATPDWYDPCLNVMIVDNNDEDPATYEEAMMSPDSNKWQEAMKSEMGSMYDNKVWTLVDLPDSRNKWIFKRKTDADGNITVYKARLVAKGFRQIQGVDYDETFSLVAKLKSVRILLAIAAFFDYEIWQMDVKTAFLNGDIEKSCIWYNPKASMVLSMSSARISRYKIDAKEDMIRNNRRQIRCPCRSCKLERWINPDSGQLEEHLLRRGFMQDNQARPAPSNGAHEDHVERDDYHHEEDYHHADGDYHHEEEVGGEDHHEEEDAGGEHHHDEEEDSGATPLISALRDSHVQDLLLQETSNDRVAARERAKLSQMEKDGMTPIFPGCRPQDTRLHVTLDYLQMKTQNKWTDSSFSKNLKFWHDRLPEGNTLPSSTEEAKKVVCPLDLPHEKYHACINDCVIYRCEYKDRTTCPVCGHGRYKVGNKKVPRKVVWYFPITPRLQRYFVDPKEAKLMQWHAERQKPEEDPEMGYMLTHPSDAGQWQALDIAFPRFGGDARNIRLGMSTDGLNPFGNQSSTHSTWPVFVWPYNLPPWLCTKQRYIHLSILIQGPKQPGVDMHLYLGLLKEELDTLWKTPPRTWDAYTRTYFDMRAALITTVTDYPGYAYVSAQVGHGFNGCVKCMDDTPHLQLPRDPGSSKTVYPGARRWLRLDHPWRKRGDLFNGKDEPDGPPRPRSGAEIDDLLKNWKECPAPGKKRPKPEPLLGVWKARSVFHDLEYWKVLHTPHSLDVMHITKNVTESLLGTLCNSEKSKDGPKARYDLKHFGIRKDLQAPDTDDDDDDDDQTEGTQRLRKRAKKNAVQLPAACFTTSPEELEQFFRCLLGVKVPHGYSGNISRYLDVAKKRFTGMKSHDCHVLMTQILPVAIRGIMDEHVRDTLFGLCNFFDVITRKSIGVRQLKMLQDEIVVILCELEIYFPPAFCDICVHLLLHVVEDIKQLGPTFLHNMMPFERQNGVMKGYVRNRARPDASMAKGFLTYECISFCQNYLSTEDDEDHVGLPPRTHLGRLAGVGHREGYRSVHVGIENRRDDFDRAHRVALQHLKLTEPFVQEHKSMVEQNYIDMGRPRKMGDVTKKHNSSFTRWFKQTQLVEAQRNTPSTEDEKLIYTLSQGPAQNVRTYQGYDINGYRFYTEEKDRNSENQNSGVTMLSYADDETNVKERFFGRIEEIWELNYCGETVPMFRVRWAKKVEKEGRYFTTMVIPDAKSKNASAKNEPWVLGSQVDQCFFITDPSRPSRVVVRRGKRSIIGMQGDANEEDLDKNGDPKMEEEFDRHFDMPTTSKFLPRHPSATTATAKRRHQAPLPPRRRRKGTATPPPSRTPNPEPPPQIKEEEDRHAAAEDVPEKEAAAHRGGGGRCTSRRKRRGHRRRYRHHRWAMQINMSGNTSKPRSQNEEAREANKDFWEGYEQPRKAAAESPDDEEEGRDAASEEEVRDTAADTGDDDDTWDDAAQTGEETTGEENAANRTEGDSGGNPQEGKKKRTARRPRRDRRPQVLANVTDAVTVVSESGLPMEPSWVAKGYGMQLGCIVRETVPILTQDLRSKENEAIAQSLLQKLHQRYTFPEPFNKKVDSLALTKMSTALSSWKNRLKRKIEAGESWERISSKDPSLSLEDFNAFKSYLESDAVKKWTAWGKKMRDLNLGTHHCGSGGYRGKQPTWDKEDAEMVRLGKENPWHKIQDEQARNFVRSRYYLDWKTGEFITDHEDVRDFEKYLDEELTKAGPSSQGSTEPWDTPFNRAMNKYKERELDKPPTSGGRVSGFGTSMKLSEYYGSDAKTRKLERRSSAKDKSEVQELKKKVETLEKLVAEKPVENTEMMNKLLDEKIRQIIPPGLMEGLAAWNAGGQVGPIHVPSISGSNSSFHVSPTVPLHPTPASGLHQTPPQLQPPPQLQLVASTPPTAALVSTVAEIDAIKEVNSLVTPSRHLL